ncbi:MAG: CoB--CoM heterodisulfide reductase iron-sulfur subunit B family protein [Firmicutes bacterium]|nr:CoB--CoM heterodisulfide reductase iron-sulfur subunit B family protein [Bacillota bacterium]
MKFTYYPGCSLHSTSWEYDASTRAVFQRLGIGLEELEDWSCCGATSAHATDDFLAKALPLRNLILAEEKGQDIMLPCAACYNTLRTTDRFVRSGTQEAREVNQEVARVMGKEYRGTIESRHVLDVLGDETIQDLIKTRLVRPLTGLKVAAYYGCLLNRPPEVVSFDIPEQPVAMDRLLELIGAEPVEWSFKTECCGGSSAIPQPEVAVRLNSRIVLDALQSGAQAIVTACPLCHVNLDTRQEGVLGKTPGSENGVPILHVTELLGIALGATPEEIHQWFSRHLVDPGRLFPEKVRVA